jgi:hypothetical protein
MRTKNGWQQIIFVVSMVAMMMWSEPVRAQGGFYEQMGDVYLTAREWISRMTPFALKADEDTLAQALLAGDYSLFGEGFYHQFTLPLYQFGLYGQDFWIYEDLAAEMVKVVDEEGNLITEFAAEPFVPTSEPDYLYREFHRRSIRL